MRKLIVVSADAMVGEDLNLFKKLPNYQKYLAGGAEITNVKSVYPTVTYPAHTSMATGNFPNKHGIVSNFPLSPGVDPLPWYWFHEDVKCKDIFDAAKEQGLTTAACSWPVTTKHPSIDYLVPEYWENLSVHDTFEKVGVKPEVLTIIDRHAAILEGKFTLHPPMDDFAVACACDLIREFQPDVLFVHPANIDGARHQNGLFHERVDHAIYQTDAYIGMLAQAAIEAGVWEETNIFLVSDHGQLGITRSLKINPLLQEAGLQTVENGKLLDWQAYSLSNGMSALIHLQDKNDKALYDQVYTLLQHLKEEGIYGIGDVLTAEQAEQQENLVGDFSFVVETDGYTSFSDDLSRPLVREMNCSDYRFGAATHGYLPHKGPQPILLANGPDIKAGVTLQSSHIVNEAPTYAKLLGLSLPDTDGTPITEILK